MANKTEHAEQVELFRWSKEVAFAGFDLVCGNAPKPYDKALLRPVPTLALLHAIPNGGSRGDTQSSIIRGSMLKAEGVKKGVPDIFLPVPNKQYHGLYIELKVADRTKGRVSREQVEFMQEVRALGYCAVVCYGADEAKSAICEYYKGV